MNADHDTNVLPDHTTQHIDAQHATANGLRRWLGSRRCQSPQGAFYAWIDGVTGTPAFEYPEITGYALTHFAGLSDQTDDEVTAGHAAAQWLIKRLSGQDLSARANWDDNAIYNFDLGMIATGLLAFGKRVDEPRYIKGGLSLVRYLQTQMENGQPFSSLDPNHSPHSRRIGWSTEGYSHLLKVVQCFLLADREGLASAGECAATLMRQILPLQQSNGRFITQPSDEVTMLHPHLYAVEGLWMWGTARGDGDAIRRAHAAINWAWMHQLGTGGLPRFVALQPGQDTPPEQLDVTSQAIRLALVLNPKLPGLPRAVARLRQTARRDMGGMALPYQPTSAELHLNAWVTLFGHQALSVAENGSSALTWQYLV